MCMDKRIHGWWFRGCYRVLNAGPRLEDSLRSILLFIELHPSSPEHPVHIVWLSHDEVCACSKAELGVHRETAHIEQHTRRMRQIAIAELARHPKIAELIEERALVLLSGQIRLSKISVELDPLPVA